MLGFVPWTNHISTQPANPPGLVKLSMISLRLFSFPLDNAERLGPCYAETSPGQSMGADGPLQDQIPQTVMSSCRTENQDLTATFHGLLCSSGFWNGFPHLSYPKCLQHLAERGHAYRSLKITFLLIPVQRYSLLFNPTLPTKLLRLKVGCSRILEIALTFFFFSLMTRGEGDSMVGKDVKKGKLG